VGFVRWTEQRNFEAVLDMMADGRLDVRPLITHRFGQADAAAAYAVVAGSEPSLGILLDYPAPADLPDEALRRRTVALDGVANAGGPREGQARVAVIGAGNYATAVLIPAFREAGAELVTVASSGGVSGLHAGRKFGFRETTTDTASALADPRVNAVVITTRHDTHAALAVRALDAGKHVFVEKPLALSSEELEAVEAARARAGRLVTVGFNRRFAPHVVRMAELLAGVREPKVFVYTVNAGAIPATHWTQDRAVGGGRIVGEACHFIDLLRHLAGSRIASWQAASVGRPVAGVADDKASVTLRFEDGSLGTILYLANGHKSFPKERLEVFAAGRVLQLDNFRELHGYGWPGLGRVRLWKQDKGQAACAAAFARAVAEGGPSPIPWDQVLEVSRVSIDVAEALA
jgi:predicted dehydrogenase